METIRNHLTWLNTMVSKPFYFSHFLVFFSYFVLRISTSQTISPHVASRLLYREFQVILTFSVVTVIKIAREETWEAFIADTLLYGKVCLIIVALIMDYHLALWYIVTFLVICILTQQPACQELGESNKLTPLQLETVLAKGSTPRYWLVEFRAFWLSSCIRTSRLFSELSITYSNQNLSFGVVDLSLFPNAAEKFGIYLDGNLSQLPIYILFDNSVEVTRFPDLDSEAKWSNHLITKKIFCQHFELDRRLIEYVKS